MDPFLQDFQSFRDVEIRPFQYKLQVELVPEFAWNHNLRTLLPESQWDVIRGAIYRRANHRCEICGGWGSKHPVECHEIWHYDEPQRLQVLKGLQALCPRCHQTKHIGFAKAMGFYEIQMAHLCKINSISRNEAMKYLDFIFGIQKRRSKMAWIMNLSWLTNHFECSWKTQETDILIFHSDGRT